MKDNAAEKSKKRGLGKKGVTRIVCLSVGAVLIAILIAANVVLSTFSLIINRFLAGDTVDASGARDVLEQADKVAREAAAESMVLLKNENDSYLPKKDLTKVNLFGWGSTEWGFLLTGGGSGGTSITDDKDIKIDLNDAFSAENIEYNRELYDAYGDFSKFDADYREKGSTGAAVHESLLNPDAGFYTEARMNQAKSFSNVAVATLSRWGAENGGMNELVSPKGTNKYPDGTFLELTSEERAMFDKLEEYGFEVIVVLNVTNNIELGFLDEYACIKACIYAGIPGQSGAIAIPQIITGKVAPSGRTADVFAYDYQTNNPVYPNAIRNGSYLTYQEGIYFGYKWYETADAEGFFDGVTRGDKTGYDAVVQFPFGYGLSYTTFEWKAKWPTDAALSKEGKYTVEVEVKNTGNAPGRDVVQLYGHAKYNEGGIEKAERVLLAFAKTKLLEKKNDTDKVSLTFSAYDLASYDAYDANHNGFKGYEIEAGGNSVEISLQRDSHAWDSALTKRFNVTQNIQYDKDPVTEKEVVNRFTGSDAYANCPIDGSTVYEDKPFEYLSRKNKFANFAGIKNVGGPSQSKEYIVNAAADFRYGGYAGEDVSSYEYGTDLGLYMTQANAGTEEEPRLVKANYELLSGEAADMPLVRNSELMMMLSDYDSPVWNFFLNELTRQDVELLISNGGFMTVALEAIGKPRCTDKDGPAGFNNNVTNAGKSSIYPLYPSESLLGCSWSTEVNYKIGEAQGKIGTELGINGWYGPGINLHRSVYNSRNYEYYSEDATLSGKLAAATVTGAKDNNLYCYVKHMAVSEAGENPKDLNTWLTEQALRESYLRAFEITVKEGHANAIMSAFNRVGAVLSGYNHAMLTDVLRVEWGFRGSVITDWFTGSGYMSDYTRGVLAGNNLWLAGTSSSVGANLNFSDPAVAYAARKSAKDILYTYVDTTLAQSSIKVNAEAKSPLYTAALVLLNVLLPAGIVLCGVFFTLSFFNLKKSTANGTPDGDGGGSDEKKPVEEKEEETPAEEVKEETAEDREETPAEEKPAEGGESSPAEGGEE